LLSCPASCDRRERPPRGHRAQHPSGLGLHRVRIGAGRRGRQAGLVSSP